MEVERLRGAIIQLLEDLQRRRQAAHFYASKLREDSPYWEGVCAAFAEVEAEVLALLQLEEGIPGPEV